MLLSVALATSVMPLPPVVCSPLAASLIVNLTSVLPASAPSVTTPPVNSEAVPVMAVLSWPVSSTVTAPPASVTSAVIVGPSSLNSRLEPSSRVLASLAVSPSPSVMVSVRVSVTRLAALRVAADTPASSASVLSLWTTERDWVSVTLPKSAEVLLLLTASVKTRALLVAVRPSTVEPLRLSTTLWPLRVSTRPLDPSTAPRV